MVRSRTVRGVLLALPLTLVVGCSTVSVRADWDEEVNFERLHSFAWFERAERGRGPQPSPLVEQRVERATTAELEAKGYAEARPRQADFLVTAHTAVRQRVVVSHIGYAYPRRWHYGWGWGATRVHRYREGSLVLDIIDARSRSLVWRGVAEGAFSHPDPSPEQVAKVVGKLLEGFPPG